MLPLPALLEEELRHCRTRTGSPHAAKSGLWAQQSERSRRVGMRPSGARCVRGQAQDERADFYPQLRPCRCDADAVTVVPALVGPLAGLTAHRDSIAARLSRSHAFLIQPIQFIDGRLRDGRSHRLLDLIAPADKILRGEGHET